MSLEPPEDLSGITGEVNSCGFTFLFYFPLLYADLIITLKIEEWL